MRSYIAVALYVASALCAAKGLAWSENDLCHTGLSVSSLKSLSGSLPRLPGNIQSIKFFNPSRDRERISVALLTYAKLSGWQIFVLNRKKGVNFALDWKSGRLDDSFSVSSPDALKVFHLADGDAFEFDGCAPHVCPDVFSVLLYVPSRNIYATANYAWGKTKYSIEPHSTNDDKYKSALDQLIYKLRNE